MMIETTTDFGICSGDTFIMRQNTVDGRLLEIETIIDMGLGGDGIARTANMKLMERLIRAFHTLTSARAFHREDFMIEYRGFDVAREDSTVIQTLAEVQNQDRNDQGE